MKISLKIVLVFVLFLFFGCDAKTKQSHNEENITIAKENNTTKVVQLAQVNGHIITNQILGNKANLFFALNEKGKKQMIEKLINDELLIQYVLAERNETNITDENFRAKRGLVLLEAESLSETLALMNEENLSSLYEKNKQKYWHNELIEASNILVDTEQEAIEIIKKLENATDLNATFAQLAKEKSVAKEASNGGYLGFFEEKRMVEPIQKALKELTQGTYTKKPVKTVYGYHILYLYSILPEGYFNLKDVKRELVLEVNRNRMDKWAYEKLQPLKENAKIEILLK